jgi:hypothetical protein
MRGRWPGLLLMLLAMIAVIAGHGLFRTDIKGSPVAIFVPGPPHRGDCVLSAPDPALQITAGIADTDGVVFGPCGGAVAGEIVSVTPGRAIAQDGSIGSIIGTAGDCWAAASRYAGLVTVDGMADVDTQLRNSIDWHPDLQVRGQELSASPLQRAAGRDWSACVVRPEGLTEYVGSVSGAVRSGVAPAEYGDCSASPDQSVRSSVSCSNPHTTERLGWAAIPTGSVSQREIDDSCRAFVARLLRTDDPTYGGVLDIVASSRDITTCAVFVQDPARLNSSLIGIGDGPLPLTM